MEVEQNGNGKSSDRRAKIPVKTFPIKKRINTALFIHGEGKRDWIKKYQTSWKRVEYWRE